MTTTKQRATKALVNAIVTEHGIKQRLLEIVQEISDKMDSGIPAPHRLEKEFDILRVELLVEVNKKAEAEVVLGIDKNFNYILN